LIRGQRSVTSLRSSYVGRRNYVYGRSVDLETQLPVHARRLLRDSLRHLAAGDNQRARAIVQYFLEMATWLELTAGQLMDGGRLVLVIGNSTVRGKTIPTADLLKLLAPAGLRLENQFSYVLRNRSMQYSRWNHANVATERVLVFVSRGQGVRTGPHRICPHAP
jgi:hypothetical protein